MAGAEGFEPPVPGPKPGALPLGYAPLTYPKKRYAKSGFLFQINNRLRNQHHLKNELCEVHQTLQASCIR